MIVGFTGTQEGMSDHQKNLLNDLLKQRVTELHHGDCIGADAEAHAIAIQAGIRIIIYPPDNPYKRAFCIGAYSSMPPRPYLERNRNIVEACDCLIAGPKSDKEELRSGTWSTVRFARKVQRSVIILSRV